jgi:hypothetical protein
VADCPGKRVNADRKTIARLYPVHNILFPVRTARGSHNARDERGASLSQRFAFLGATRVPKRFKVGVRVGWNSEAGQVSGTMIRVHTRDFDYKGTENSP